MLGPVSNLVQGQNRVLPQARDVHDPSLQRGRLSPSCKSNLTGKWMELSYI